MVHVHTCTVYHLFKELICYIMGVAFIEQLEALIRNPRQYKYCREKEKKIKGSSLGNIRICKGVSSLWNPKYLHTAEHKCLLVASSCLLSHPHFFTNVSCCQTVSHSAASEPDSKDKTSVVSWDTVI